MNGKTKFWIMMCSWHFTIRERNLIHSLCILVTKFNPVQSYRPSSTFRTCMMPLTGQAWTERCSAFFQFLLKLILNNRRLFLFTGLGYVGAKLVAMVYQVDCGDHVHLEDILSGVSLFLFIATCF